MTAASLPLYPDPSELVGRRVLVRGVVTDYGGGRVFVRVDGLPAVVCVVAPSQVEVVA